MASGLRFDQSNAFLQGSDWHRGMHAHQHGCVDFTRFSRHLLRSKMNWSDYHEDSEIPSRMLCSPL